MTKRYTLLLACTLLLSAFGACNKDKDMVDATIVDTGDITNEGCGYLLQLEDKAVVQPSYLPSAYQHGGLKVKVKYNHTGIKDTCKFGSVIYDLVSIQEIKRKNDN